MSSRPLKGSVAEKAAEAYLTADGWTVHRARAVMVNPAPGKFFVFSHDLWGAIDLAGIHPQRGFLFVQVATITGKTGSLDYANVAKRRKKIEALPWPPQMAIVHQSGDAVGIAPLYRVAVWGARNQRIGRLAARWFQIWDYDVDRRLWALQPQRIAISGPVPGDVSKAP